MYVSKAITPAMFTTYGSKCGKLIYTYPSASTEQTNIVAIVTTANFVLTPSDTVFLPVTNIKNIQFF